VKCITHAKANVFFVIERLSSVFGVVTRLRAGRSEVRIPLDVRDFSSLYTTALL
jgi:hypothetical protein